MKKLNGILFTLTSTIFSCSAPTGYYPARSDTSFGYTDLELEPNIYKIEFRGNGATELSVAELHWRTRAAELCAESDFNVIEYETEMKTDLLHYVGASVGTYAGTVSSIESSSIYFPRVFGTVNCNTP